MLIALLGRRIDAGCHQSACSARNTISGLGKKSAEYKPVERLRSENQTARTPVQKLDFALGVSYAGMQHRVSGVNLECRCRIAESLARRSPTGRC